MFPSVTWTWNSSFAMAQRERQREEERQCLSPYHAFLGAPLRDRNLNACLCFQANGGKK